MNLDLFLAALILMPKPPYNRVCDADLVRQYVEQAQADDLAGIEWGAMGAIGYAYKACNRRK